MGQTAFGHADTRFPHELQLSRRGSQRRLDNALGEFILFVDGDDRLMNDSAMTILYNAAQGHNAVRMTDHGLSGGTVKFSKRLTMWLHFFSRELIGSDRFTDMLLNEDFEFVRRIRNKPGYNEATVDVPLYFYNYDRARMIARIEKRDRAFPRKSETGIAAFACQRRSLFPTKWTKAQRRA